ncbi:hypothetical protein [Falsibacillus pallidus]|jgi:hypothetical protein|uniref:Uncharacterized protein n=1 Tax=Falsibacillus pallidus TaxID=493781 RepID=A0A370GHD7_9BACI|nr:hypothetical protein [Falsibacillus pallidus]RDI43215.1 hypothetical protein DFR59_104270 [Falsibacillus pallidus]
MTFPIIHTNFWDAVLAIPVIMILTQFIKLAGKLPKSYVPALALLLGIIISVFYSHKGHLISGLFMGYFYGYAAIGSYASLKTTILSFRNRKAQAP